MTFALTTENIARLGLLGGGPIEARVVCNVSVSVRLPRDVGGEAVRKFFRVSELS